MVGIKNLQKKNNIFAYKYTFTKYYMYLIYFNYFKIIFTLFIIFFIKKNVNMYYQQNRISIVLTKS